MKIITNRGGETYTAPLIEVISVEAEKGFAQTDLEINGASGNVNDDKDYTFDDPYAGM